MPHKQGQHSLHHYIRGLFRTPAADQTDRQMLEHFARNRDEVAFSRLVERHAPLVWSVCRRVLGNEHDAEDAFQATFLVLARKAGSVRWQDEIGNWLYTVAVKVARKAKAQTERRRAHEKEALPMPAADAVSDADRQELCAILDEEVARLPEKYRRPVVLCCLNGKTYSEAAHLLGWPEGTVSGRLARAREMLARQLARRGLAPASGLLAAVLVPELVSAAPPALVQTTIQNALAFATGQTIAAGSAVDLAEGVLQTMFLKKLKVGAAVVAALAFIAIGVGVRAFSNGNEQRPEEPAQPVVKAEGKDTSAGAPKAELVKPLSKEVIAAWQKAGAKLHWLEVTPSGQLHWYEATLPPRPGAVPGFSLREEKGPVKLKGLPAPDADFAVWNVDLTPEAIKELAAFPRLTTVVLPGVNPEVIKELAKLKRVSVLCIEDSNGNLNDEMLKQVASLPQLSVLSVHPSGNVYISITDDGLKELARAKNLASLHLEGAKVTGVGVKALAGLEHLTTVSLPFCPVTNDGLKEIAGLKQLRVLDLRTLSSMWKVTDEGVVHLARLKNLTYLGLAGPGFTADGLRTLAPLQALTTLDLTISGSDEHLKVLDQFKNLRHLNLWGTRGQVTAAGLKHLAKLKHLTDLRLNQTDMTDDGMKDLAALTNLTVLDLCNTRVTEQGLRELAPLKKLVALGIWASEKDAGIKELAAFPRLTYLSVHVLSDDGLRELAKLKQLAWLAVPRPTSHDGITYDGLAQLRKALPRCTIQDNNSLQGLLPLGSPLE